MVVSRRARPSRSARRSGGGRGDERAGDENSTERTLALDDERATEHHTCRRIITRPERLPVYSTSFHQPRIELATFDVRAGEVHFPFRENRARNLQSRRKFSRSQLRIELATFTAGKVFARRYVHESSAFSTTTTPAPRGRLALATGWRAWVRARRDCALAVAASRLGRHGG